MHFRSRDCSGLRSPPTSLQAAGVSGTVTGAAVAGGWGTSPAQWLTGQCAGEEPGRAGIKYQVSLLLSLM